MIVYSVLNNNKNNNNDDNNSNNNNNMWNIYETTVLFQDLALTVQHFNAFEELSPNSDKFWQFWTWNNVAAPGGFFYVGANE